MTQRAKKAAEVAVVATKLDDCWNYILSEAQKAVAKRDQLVADAFPVCDYEDPSSHYGISADKQDQLVRDVTALLIAESVQAQEDVLVQVLATVVWPGLDRVHRPGRPSERAAIETTASILAWRVHDVIMQSFEY